MTNKRVLVVALGALLVLAVAIVGWYLASPLFFDTVVDEGFPFDTSGVRQVESRASDARASNDNGPLDISLVMTSVDQEVAAGGLAISDSSDWLEIANGSFVGADSFHQGSGRVSVYEQGDDRILRLEDFSVTNGPDLHLILTKHPAPSDPSDVGEDYLDLGSLKGNVGSQNYEIPAGFDLSEYKGVVIYCVPFHVVFATATLS